MSQASDVSGKHRDAETDVTRPSRSSPPAGDQTLGGPGRGRALEERARRDLAAACRDRAGGRQGCGRTQRSLRTAGGWGDRDWEGGKLGGGHAFTFGECL